MSAFGQAFQLPLTGAGIVGVFFRDVIQQFFLADISQPFSEAEARAFLRVLSGRLPNHVRVTGDFFVNGHRLNPQQFASRTGRAISYRTGLREWSDSSSNGAILLHFSSRHNRRAPCITDRSSIPKD